MSVLAGSLLHAVVPATDLGRAREFYEDVLGLAPMMDTEDAVAFEARHGSMILVYLRPGGQPPESTAAGFLVDDIVSTVEELKNRGVEFEHYDMEWLQTDERGIFSLDDGSMSAWFKDSEGNIISVSQVPG